MRSQLNTDQIIINESRTKSFLKQKVLLTSLFFIVAVAVILVMFLPNGNNNEKTIAVLPFKNLSTDENNELFCDGLAEDILTYLQRVDGLVVLSFTSVKKYRNSNKTISNNLRSILIFLVRLYGFKRIYDHISFTNKRHIL